MRNLVARMTSRIFLGLPTCRDPEWIDLSIQFPMDTFTAAFTLRRFPPWAHYLVAPFIPERYRMRAKINKAQSIIAPVMEQYRSAKDHGTHVHKDSRTSKDDTLLQWMIDHGNDKENDSWEMATRQCILSLASIHTTSMTVSNVIFDICAHPEWLHVLEDEINDTIRDFGAIGARLGPKEWLAKLEKMDSFIVECQRLNPPILRKSIYY